MHVFPNRPDGVCVHVFPNRPDGVCVVCCDVMQAPRDLLAQVWLLYLPTPMKCAVMCCDVL